MAQAPEKEKSVTSAETLPGISERLEEPEVGVEGYLEKVERRPEEKPVSDKGGATLLSPTDHTQPTITLPLTDEETKRALHLKIADSIRWLASWCVRMGKKAILNSKWIF